jgi:hypothetical protein
MEYYGAFKRIMYTIAHKIITQNSKCRHYRSHRIDRAREAVARRTTN